MTVELRVEVAPRWPFRLPGPGPDGILRRHGAGLQRVLHVGGEPVHLAAIQPAPDRVILGARAATEEAAGRALERLRFALAVDDDLRPFHAAFRGDPVIGRALRANPRLRTWRRPEPWEALLAAVTEQLITFEEAVAIQRRIHAALGPRCPATGLRDVPPPAAIAATAPARLESFGLSAGRAIALRRAAIEVAAGRADLRATPHEPVWRRLRTIPGIGRWTIELLALHGQGRFDHVAAGDLHFLKTVGRLATGNPRARADEAEVRGFFERYGEWRGLAGQYLIWASARGLLPAGPLLSPARPSPDRAPLPAGTRWSAPAPRRAAA